MRLRRAGPAEAAPEPETSEQRIVQTLADAETPRSQRQISERAATRPATVGAALEKLVREHRVECAPGGGYRLAGAGKHRQDPLPKTVTASNSQGATVTVTGNTRRQLPHCDTASSDRPVAGSLLAVMAALRCLDGGGSPEGPQRSGGAV